MKPGSAGQFDVVADGEVIASKKGGLLAGLFGGGWPDPDAVIAALRPRLGKQKQR